MFDIKISPAAVNDLEEIRDYIADNAGEETSIAVIQSLLDSLKILQDFPGSGSPLSSVINMDTDYRYLVCSNYKIFYRVSDNCSYVIRILHNRRDFMKVLF